VAIERSPAGGMNLVPGVCIAIQWWSLGLQPLFGWLVSAPSLYQMLLLPQNHRTKAPPFNQYFKSKSLSANLML